MTDNETMQLQSANAQNYTGAQSVSMDNCAGSLTGGYVQTTGCVQYWPYQTFPSYWPSSYPVYIMQAPTECCGDVHIFACQKCGECKCGKARLAKAKK